MFAAIFQSLPVIVSLEHQFYDALQKGTTIDSKEDYFYETYKEYLDEIILINIDSTLIDKETDRIKRDKLALFFQKIKKNKDDIKCIFFDYGFFKPSKHDSALVEGLKPFSEKLILPFYFEFKQHYFHAIQNPMPDSQISHYTKPIFNNCNLAYVKAYKEPFTGKHRFVFNRIETTGGSQFLYAPYLIARKFNPEKIPHLKTEQFNGFSEIKYLVRNDDKLNRQRAMPVYAMNDFIAQIPENAIKNLVTNKLVFVGLFENYKTKYGLEIDKFATPVKSNLSGPQLIVNAYLNLVGNTFIGESKLWHTFLIHFIVGIFVAGYQLKITKDKVFILLFLFFGNLTISFVLFPIVALIFFVFANIKLMIIIPTILFLQHKPLFNLFKIIYLKLFYKKNN